MRSDEIGPPSPGTARSRLASVHADRRKLGHRASSVPCYPFAVSALAAAFVILPATGSLTWFVLLSGVFSAAAFAVVEGYRKHTGFAITRPPGPRSLTILLILGVLLVALFAVSWLLSMQQAHQWLPATFVGGFLVALICSKIYDRAVSRELQDVR